MPRLPEPERDRLDEAQRRAYDTVASGPGGGVRGPMGVWVRRPDFAEKARMLGRYLRHDSSLATNLSELAILVTARVWSAEYAWRAHRQVALEAGLDPAVIEGIRCRRTPSFANDEERAVYEFATELNRDRFVSQALYDRTVEVLGLERTIDLVGVLGFYTLIAMTINAFEVTHPDGGPDELAP